MFGNETKMNRIQAQSSSSSTSAMRLLPVPRVNDVSGLGRAGSAQAFVVKEARAGP